MELQELHGVYEQAAVERAQRQQQDLSLWLADHQASRESIRRAVETIAESNAETMVEEVKVGTL